MRIGYIEMEDQGAISLLNKGRIKIGWVYCRIRKRIIVTRCHKCLGYGHMKRDCTGPDRTDVCWKCGNKGHKAAQCKNNPSCDQKGATLKKIGSNITRNTTLRSTTKNFLDVQTFISKCVGSSKNPQPTCTTFSEALPCREKTTVNITCCFYGGRRVLQGVKVD
ncbi:hypothetical protein J437_LFUL006565 [Ladona fulva]|uniref:CCHC-type domain-containing protein n=1 Tax=Ladona fulva TaxID=123851 RepID=A0A8K0KAM1_LADFU|nr:hypothetical protein J437_LFUL006565 [Ladona fulva]